MNTNRPVNLDLTTMKFPAMAIASILHRVSGIVMFLLTPYILYLLGVSLKSAEGFATMQGLLAHPLGKFALWAFAVAMSYHLLAGIRHVLMDMGWGEQLSAGRRSAVFVIVLAVVVAIVLGVALW